MTEPFFRAEQARSTPGSGLGLAIVQRTLQRMRGQLRLELPEGGGLAAIVTLPAATPTG